MAEGTVIICIARRTPQEMSTTVAAYQITLQELVLTSQQVNMMQWIGVSMAVAALVAVATAELEVVTGYVGFDSAAKKIIINYDNDKGFFNIPSSGKASDTIVPITIDIKGGYLSGILAVLESAATLAIIQENTMGKKYIEIQLDGLSQKELESMTMRKPLTQKDVIAVEIAGGITTQVERATGISFINVEEDGELLKELDYITIGVPTPGDGITRAVIQMNGNVGLIPVTDTNHAAFAPVTDVMGYITVSPQKPHFGFIPAEKPGQGYIHARPIPGLNNIPIAWPPPGPSAEQPPPYEFIIVTTSPREYRIQVDTKDFSYIEVQTPFGLGFIQVHPTQEKAYIPLDNNVAGPMGRWGYIAMDLASYTPIDDLTGLEDDEEEYYPYHVAEYEWGGLE